MPEARIIPLSGGDPARTSAADPSGRAGSDAVAGEARSDDTIDLTERAARRSARAPVAEPAAEPTVIVDADRRDQPFDTSERGADGSAASVASAPATTVELEGAAK